MRALLKREIRVAWRAGGGALTGVLFFLAVVTVFPFAVGPDTRLLSHLAPAILWIGALFASLLGLDRIFAQEREDGSLDLLVMQSHPLMLTIFTKTIAHWVISGLPLVLVTPLFGLMLNLPPLGIGVTMLISVLVLPLVIPVLVFGIASIVGAFRDPDPFTAPFLLLCAITLFTSVLGPLAASIMLRHSAD